MDRNCPICLDPISKEATAITSCKHLFCKDCLIHWTLESLSCPVCKTKIEWYSFKGKKIKTSTPIPLKPEDPSINIRTARDLQIEEIFKAVERGAISEIEASAYLEFIGTPETRVDQREPREGIVHYKEAAIIGCFDALSQELKNKWQRPPVVKGTREAFSVGREDFNKYPILARVISNVWENPELRLKAQPSNAWINFYKDGTYYTPWHQDSYESTVVNISVGDTRSLLTKPSRGEAAITEKYICEDGDVVIFTKEWNSEHKHCVPKTKKKSYGRISIVLFVVE